MSRGGRIVVRVLVVASMTLAALIVLLAFAPYGFTATIDADCATRGPFMALAAVIGIVPGAAVWERPRPSLLWLWTAIALVASIAMASTLDNVGERAPGHAIAHEALIKICLSMFGLVTTLGTFIAGFAIQAGEARYRSESTDLAVRLRRMIYALGALALGLLIVGGLPGQQAYGDSPWVAPLREAKLAGGLPLALYLLIVLAPGWPLYRDPSARRAWWWFGWSIIGAALAAALVVSLEVHVDTAILWPTRVVEAGVAAIQITLLLGLPLTIARSRTPRIPGARVVSQRSQVSVGGSSRPSQISSSAEIPKAATESSP